MTDSKQTLEQQQPVEAPEPEPETPVEAAETPVEAAETPVEAAEPDVVDEHALEGDVDELVQVAGERDEYLALAQRTQADFENYRKRVARESVQAQERGVAKLVKELLPALDNLDRALAEAASAAEGSAADGPAAAPGASDGVDGQGDPLLHGVRLVRDELAAALARVGVESFSPSGEPFDPELHEAMAQRTVPGAAAGTVAEVYQPGYRLGEQIIRPARVVVAA